MLNKEPLAEADGITVADVRCVSGTSAWSTPEGGSSYGLVFVRRGLFRRRVNGTDSLVDPTVAYVERPHEEQQVSHPLDGGDACTAVSLHPDTLTCMLGAEVPFPADVIAVDSRVDLQHRLLVSACRKRAGRFVVAERTLLLVLAVLDSAAPMGAHARRRSTHLAHRALVDGVRQVLMHDPVVGLLQLAASMHVSPAHLSRTFRDQTGMSVSRFRTRLRVGLALERLTGGEGNLATLAADLGFSDHSHLGRVLRQELGHAPSQLRAALATPD